MTIESKLNVRSDDFKANAAVLKSSNEQTKSLLDIMA